MNKEKLLAENEGYIEASDLLAELVPILSDFFLGDIESDGTNVRYRLPNGQSFLISITQER